jgi:hypothetical protein
VLLTVFVSACTDVTKNSKHSIILTIYHP